jgi:hypothetical protein
VPAFTFLWVPWSCCGRLPRTAMNDHIRNLFFHSDGGQISKASCWEVGSSSEDEREDLFHASLLVSGGCPQCLVFFQW